MAEQKSNPILRYATFTGLGASLGAVIVHFFGVSLGMESPMSGAIGGGVAGLVSAFVRAQTGLDK